MEEHKEFGREIVSTYRQPDRREVVEVYSRPLPGHEEKQPSAAPSSRQRRGKRKKSLLIFLLCFAVVTLLALGGRLLAQVNDGAAVDPFEKYYDEETAEEDSEEITIAAFPTGQGVEFSLVRDHGETLTAQKVYRRVNPSVVTVMVSLGEQMSVGTGVIFTADGYIITNYHVLAGGRECVVATDSGYTYPASYVAGDADRDLAVLKIDGTDLPTAEFGDSDLLTVGDQVYAIGNPLGVELRGTLTDGIISAINRNVWVDDRSMTLIQTNAALNSGNSGGPLINEYGQVVGINVIKMTSRYSNVEGLGFAIPTASMERIINDLLTYGESQPEPLLGITVISLAEEAADGVWGLRVDSVTPGGAGDQAGVRAGDFVLAADGESLSSSQELLRIRGRFHLGDTMELTIWRDGEILEVMLELKEAVDEESSSQDGEWEEKESEKD